MTDPRKLYDFRQVDVFSQDALRGNPLAVVRDAAAISATRMAEFANWNNLSETTYLLPPEDPAADYRLRIFTPTGELPFAGHPTLGSAHVWLEAGGVPKGRDIVQECGAGLVRIRREGARLAFMAPPLRREGPAEPEVAARLLRGLKLAAEDVEAIEWVDNGPGWVLVLMRSREKLLALRPDYTVLDGLEIGVCAPWTGPAAEADFEIRAFSTPGVEDPVTGSLNAGVAQVLFQSGRVRGGYLARQGTALGRRGNVHVSRDEDGIWIGGEVADCIRGTVLL